MIELFREAQRFQHFLDEHAWPFCFIGGIALQHSIFNFNINFNSMKSISMVEFRRNARAALDAVRRGERVLLTYRGQPVARLEPVGPSAPVVPDDDPLLRLDDFAVPGAGGRLTNQEIDRLVYEP